MSYFRDLDVGFLDYDPKEGQVFSGYLALPPSVAHGSRSLLSATPNARVRQATAASIASTSAIRL
jgi:hypothetical protein